MPDREDGRLRSAEQHAEPAGEARRGACPTLAATRGRRVGQLSPGPGAVVVERAAVEATEVDLVQLRNDEPGNLPAGEREVERLLCSPKLGRDAEIDVLVGQDRGEAASLLATLGRQASPRRRARRRASLPI
jgi:hypothetical protein